MLLRWDRNRITGFQGLIKFKLRDIKERLLRAKAKANAKPPPLKIEIKLPPEWFAEEIDEGVRAKSIEETKEKRAPICHYALKEWHPKDSIRVTDGYVYVGTHNKGFKVSRTTCGVWWDHTSSKRKPKTNLLDVFMAHLGSPIAEKPGEN
jgi:hypothetical protein